MASSQVVRRSKEEVKKLSDTVFCLLKDLLKAVEAAEKERVKQMIQALQPFLEQLDPDLVEVFKSEENPLRGTSLILFCCKCGQISILDYILSDFRNFNYRLNLYNRAFEKDVTPLDEDEEGHSAFYYAIRSNNLEFVHLLWTNWRDYFDIDIACQDILLSRAYEDLKLRNVKLTDAMEMFVQRGIVEVRLFADNDNESDDSPKPKFKNSVFERIDWFLNNIDSLMTEEVESKFLVIVKCIAVNINVLKQLLKATYDILPWEELEFCVVSYILSRLHHKENSMLPIFAITKETLFSQLGNVAAILKNISLNYLRGPNEFPDMSRENAASKIKNDSPEFLLLYEVYQKVRDIHSLERIEEYLKLSRSANHKEKQGQLAVLRVLQVLSDYVRNTHDICKLSDATTRVILSALPKNIRNIVIDLRNAASHPHSLKKRLEIEMKSPEFFQDVQNNLKRLSYVVSRILNNEKLRTIIDLLGKITKTDNVAEVCELGKRIKQVRKCIDVENFDLLEEEKIRRLVTELGTAVPIPGLAQLPLFDDVMTCLAKGPPDSKVRSVRAEISTVALQCIDFFKSFDRKLDATDLVLVKSTATLALDSLSSTKYVEKMSKVLEFTKEIECNIKRRSHYLKYMKYDVEKVNMLLFEISFAATTKVDEVICMDTIVFGEPMVNSKLFTSKNEKEKLLEAKLVGLRNIVGCEGVENQMLAVELLVLDILSILDQSKCESEIDFPNIEDHTPLLAGESLMNYLAHDDALMKIFPNTPATAIKANVLVFLMGKIPIQDHRIGKVFRDDVREAKEVLLDNLIIVTNQDQFFREIEKGDMEEALDLITYGADMFGRGSNDETSLHFAAKSQNLDLVKYIVEKNVEADSTDIKGRTALHVAAAHGNIAVVEHLILHVPNVKVNQKDKKGRTPLHSTAKHGSPETVALLIKLGADISPKDIFLQTPLFTAIENNNVDVVKTLLEHGADMNGLGINGRLTPLHVAAEHNHVDIMKLMLEKGANVDINNDCKGTPLLAAAENGYVEAVELLIKAGANVNAYVTDLFTALHVAADNGHTAVVALLLQNGADTETPRNPNKPIHCAAQNGLLEIVKLLIQHKADLNRRNPLGVGPLHLAALNGHADVVQVLIESGVDVNVKDREGARALHSAASNGHLEATKVLLLKGAQVNAKDVYECRPLHLAAEGGHYDVAEFLIKCRAEINVARKVDGFTPLYLAARKMDTLLVRLLLEFGAEPNTKNSNGATALHVATAVGNIEGVKDLIEYKSDVNLVDNDGVTPSHIAAGLGSCEIAEILLKNGADTNLTCLRGVTALYSAVQNEHFDMVKLLVTNGAKINLGKPLPVLKAVANNSKDILDYLIKQGADTSNDELLLKAVGPGFAESVRVLLENGYPANTRSDGDRTALHLAAAIGFKNIVSDLLHYGADVNSTASDESTPLHHSIKRGNCEVVEVLLSSGANVNSKTSGGHTPLHVAADSGDSQIIELLLENGADPLDEAKGGETPLAQSIRSCDVEKVKAMLKCKMVDKTVHFWNKLTPLHLSAAYSLDVVKLFVKHDVIPDQVLGSLKPIHIACDAGKQDIVEYFLDSGVSVNETCCHLRTPLHYAATRGNLPLIKYLVSKGADVNAKDSSKKTPLMLALKYGAIVRFLFENGAVFDEKMSFDDADKSYLDAVDLLKAVKKNDVSEVEKHIKIGTCLNAVSWSSGGCLHFACCKGYFDVVKLLLENKANPNVVATKGCTPLHYAVKFSGENIVLELLTHGAMYNSLTDTKNTPLSLAKDNNVQEILSLIAKCFDLVEKKDVGLECTIEKIKNKRHLEALIKTRNRNNESIFKFAEDCKYPKPKRLYELCHTDLIKQQEISLKKQKYEKMYGALKSVFEKQRELLGLNNPAVIALQHDICNILLELERYADAMKLAEYVLEKRKNLFGQQHRLTLQTKRIIGVLHHKMGDSDESLEILDDVWRTQIKTTGRNNEDSCLTALYSGLVLKDLGKSQFSENCIVEAYSRMSDKNLNFNHFSVEELNKFAQTLSYYGHFIESMEVFKKVYDKNNEMYGPNHAETLRTLQEIGNVHFQQMDFVEALKVFIPLAETQKTHLGVRHPDYFRTQNFLEQVLFAFSSFKKDFVNMRGIVGKYVGRDVAQIIRETTTYLTSPESKPKKEKLNEVIAAAMRGDLDNLKELLEKGCSVNETDSRGRTALQFAVDRVDAKCVQLLLKYDADVTNISHKGNTVLHTAVNKQNVPIVKMLLEHAFNKKKIEFIHTPTLERGNTPLHVAAKNGSLNIVKLLLRFGGNYEMENRDGATPKDLCSNVEVVRFLNVISDMFSDAKNGNFRLITRLKAMTKEDVTAVANVKNKDGWSILQVAVRFRHKNILSNLTRIFHTAHTR